MCNHDWTGKLIHGGWRHYHTSTGLMPEENRRVRTCAKCGMSKTFWKFLGSAYSDGGNDE